MNGQQSKPTISTILKVSPPLSLRSDVQTIMPDSKTAPAFSQSTIYTTPLKKDHYQSKHNNNNKALCSASYT